MFSAISSICGTTLSFRKRRQNHHPASRSASTAADLWAIRPRSFSEIHRHIFRDVYPWAGELRTVSMSKGESLFCRHEFIAVGRRTYFDPVPQRKELRCHTQGYYSANVWLITLAKSMLSILFGKATAVPSVRCWNPSLNKPDTKSISNRFHARRWAKSPGRHRSAILKRLPHVSKR